MKSHFQKCISDNILQMRQPIKSLTDGCEHYFSPSAGTSERLLSLLILQLGPIISNIRSFLYLHATPVQNIFICIAWMKGNELGNNQQAKASHKQNVWITKKVTTTHHITNVTRKISSNNNAAEGYVITTGRRDPSASWRTNGIEGN